MKEISVKAFIQNFSIDVLAVQQLDVYWYRVGNNKKIWDICREWQKSCNLSVDFNTEDSDRISYQSGGTSVVSTGKITHKWDSAGVDEKNWVDGHVQGIKGVMGNTYVL